MVEKPIQRAGEAFPFENPAETGLSTKAFVRVAVFYNFPNLVPSK